MRAGLRTAAAASGDADAAEQALEQLPAGAGRSRRARACGATSRVRDRVAAVERDVGLVGAELVAVVRHVPAPVEVDRRERREAEQPAADPVVDLAVAEQQPVRGLVHERRELRVGAAHEQERGDPHERGCRATPRATMMPSVCAYSDDAPTSALRRFGMRRSSSRNARRGPGVGGEAVGRVEVVEQLGRGEHRARSDGQRHDRILHSRDRWRKNVMRPALLERPLSPGR